MSKSTTIYLYADHDHNLELEPWRCNKCSRMIFKYKGAALWITNSGLPYDKISPELRYFEIMCHSCKTTYKVIFQ